MFQELADRQVTLLLVAETSRFQVAKAVTQTIPIVFSLGVDPVENGFIASLSKPGGNATGIFNLNSTTMGKRFEILHELVPSPTKFALLTGGGELLSRNETKDAQAAASSLGIDLVLVRARIAEEMEAAFETSVREGARGMVIGSDGAFVDPKPWAALGARYGLPVISTWDRSVREGVLISYGTDEAEYFRIAGHYAARILKGENPAEVPVQQATKTKLAINLKTAKEMGITVPTLLLGRADEIIE